MENNKRKIILLKQNFIFNMVIIYKYIYAYMYNLTSYNIKFINKLIHIKFFFILLI